MGKNNRKPSPFDAQRLADERVKIDLVAALAATKLGAGHVLVVAFYQDGDYVHMVEGGTCPIPKDELHHKLANKHAMLKMGVGGTIGGGVA